MRALFEIQWNLTRTYEASHLNSPQCWRGEQDSCKINRCCPFTGYDYQVQTMDQQSLSKKQLISLMHEHKWIYEHLKVQHLPPLQYNSPSTDAKQLIVFSFKSCHFDNMIHPNLNNIQLQMIWKVEQSHTAAGYFGIVYPMMWRMTSKPRESAA